MSTATTRQRRLDEKHSHEVYYRGEPVALGLTAHEAKQARRVLARRDWQGKKSGYRR